MTKRWLFWIGMGFLFLVFLFLIRAILLPFVLGMGTAYFLDPAADKLEKAGLSRGTATVVITVCFFLTIILAALTIGPLIVHQLAGLIGALPEYFNIAMEKYGTRFSVWIGELPVGQMDGIKAGLTDFSGVAAGLGGKFITGLFASGIAIVNLFSLFLLAPVVAFYLLRDWDKLVAWVDKLLPRPHAQTIREQLHIIDQTLAGFVRGQILVCLIMGIYYALGLTLAGLEYGFVIGMLTGALMILPYLGFGLGMVIGIATALFQFENIGDIGMVVGVFMIGQVIESYFITPKLVGDRVGLHPVWIIFGMLAGAALFGFVGILLAVPITAIIGVLIRFASQRYLQSSYYQGEATILPPRAQ